MKPAPHSHTFIDTPIETYLDVLKRKNYSNKSIESYRNALDRLTDYLALQGVLRVQDVTSDHLDHYRLSLTDRLLSNATLYMYLRCVRYFFGYLKETHQIFINPATNLVIPKFKRVLKQVPSVDEILRLLEQPDTESPTGLRDRAFLETMYSCGLRREETVSMTLHAPDLKEGVLRVNGKGNKERVVPMGEKASHWITRYLDDVRPQLVKDPEQQVLWISQKGNRLSRSTVDKMIRRYGISAGIEMKMSPHVLRRACATHMLNNGAHPVELQLFLGHSDLKNLSQYLKVTITEMKAMHERSRVGQ